MSYIQLPHVRARMLAPHPRHGNTWLVHVTHETHTPPKVGLLAASAAMCSTGSTSTGCAKSAITKIIASHCNVWLAHVSQPTSIALISSLKLLHYWSPQRQTHNSKSIPIRLGTLDCCSVQVEQFAQASGTVYTSKGVLCSESTQLLMSDARCVSRL